MRQPHFIVYKDKKKQFRWRFLAGNGRKLANSGEAYHNMSDCIAALDLVRGSSTAIVMFNEGKKNTGKVAKRK